MAGGIRLNDITATLHQSVFAHIPDDGPRPLRAINSGLPLVVRYPRSPASKAITRMAKDLLGMKSANSLLLSSSYDADQSRRDALMASSQFG
jgi:MinD-like ATPase involved in chromosome partitioning or flagellar assembly